MTSDYIELDALATTPEQPPPHQHNHTFKSMILTPRTDASLMQRIRSLFTSELHPGVHIAHKDANGLRHMFLITSNSYLDREDETMTSEALKAYEASCYPGAGLFTCDNPLLWWHDDDVPIGELVAVNYSEPFLVEVARELPNPVAKVLWDYAEANGDNAGASHRFGYREEDRLPNGDYTRIFKQESTYLPDRALAANIGTYAGVIKEMSTAESDKRLNQIFEQATGIKDAASKIHAKSGALEKELAALGIGHKAKKQKAEGDMPMDEEVPTDGEEVPVEEAKVEGVAADLGQIIALVSQLYALISEQVSSQEYLMDSQMAMGKELKALKDKALNQTLEQRIGIIEKRLNMQARTVTQEKGSNPESLKAVIETAIKEKDEGNLVEVPGWGKLAPPIDYSSVTGK